MAAPHNSASDSSKRFCPKIKFGKRRNTLCTRKGCAASVSQLTLATAALYPQGVCRIRKPAYAGNGCAIFQVFQTARLGRKIRCCPQTQLCGVAFNNFPFSPPDLPPVSRRDFSACGQVFSHGLLYKFRFFDIMNRKMI